MTVDASPGDTDLLTALRVARPRIAILLATLPEPDRKPGGADVLAHRAADALARRGHDVTVISYSPKPGGAAYYHERLSPDVLVRHRALRLLVLPWLWHRVRTSRFDVLHLHGVDWFFFPRSRPSVRTFHGSALHEARTATSWKRRWSQYLVFGLEVVAARLATTTYASSGADGAVYGVRGALTCGVDVDVADGEERDGPPVILFVGAWEGRKRGGLLAQVFERDVLPAIPHAELWMVCDRVETGAGIRLFQRPTDTELQALYRRATVFCLPSSYEGLGIPYIEAMAAGLPVVSSDNPGARWVLKDGEVGRIVEDHRLGPALVDLLRDPIARGQLRDAGLRRAEDYSWDAVCAAHLAAYADAISGWDRRGRGA